MAGPDHPLAGRTLTSDQVRRQTWNLGPSAVEADGVVPAMLRNLGVPEPQQRIFQSHAAALEETKRSNGAALAVALRGRRVTWPRAGWSPSTGPGLRAQGRWTATALPASTRRRPPPSCCASSPPRGPPRRWSAAPGVNLGRFKPAVHVTLWS